MTLGRRRGRRKIYKTPRRLNIRLSDTEYREAQALCDKKGVPMTQVFRRAGLDVLGITRTDPEND